MGTYDTVLTKSKAGESREIQFKVAERLLHNYNVNDGINIPDGIYFGWEGCFVVKEKKILAAFAKEDSPLTDKWGNEIPYPDIGELHQKYYKDLSDAQQTEESEGY